MVLGPHCRHWVPEYWLYTRAAPSRDFCYPALTRPLVFGEACSPVWVADPGNKKLDLNSPHRPEGCSIPAPPIRHHFSPQELAALGTEKPEQEGGGPSGGGITSRLLLRLVRTLEGTAVPPGGRCARSRQGVAREAGKGAFCPRHRPRQPCPSHRP